MSDPLFAALTEVSTAHGLQFVSCAEHHWQLRDERRVISNVWPTKYKTLDWWPKQGTTVKHRKPDQVIQAIERIARMYALDKANTALNVARAAEQKRLQQQAKRSQPVEPKPAVIQPPPVSAPPLPTRPRQITASIIAKPPTQPGAKQQQPSADEPPFEPTNDNVDTPEIDQTPVVEEVPLPLPFLSPAARFQRRRPANLDLGYDGKELRIIINGGSFSDSFRLNPEDSLVFLLKASNILKAMQHGIT